MKPEHDLAKHYASRLRFINTPETNEAVRLADAVDFPTLNKAAQKKVLTTIWDKVSTALDHGQCPARFESTLLRIEHDLATLNRTP